MMRADFGNESADAVMLALSGIDPALAATNLPEGGWVSNILVQGQSLCVVREPARLVAGREAVGAIQQKWQGLQVLKSIAKRDANSQSQTTGTAHALIGRRILVAKPEDTTYPERPTVTFQPAVVCYQNPLILRSREGAHSYVGSVKAQLEAAGEGGQFHTFTSALKAHKEGELNTSGLRDLMAQLMAGYPQLLQGFEAFLPPLNSPGLKSNAASGCKDEGKVAEQEDEGDDVRYSMFVAHLDAESEANGDGGNASNSSMVVLMEKEVRACFGRELHKMLLEIPKMSGVLKV